MLAKSYSKIRFGECGFVFIIYDTNILHRTRTVVQFVLSLNHRKTNCICLFNKKSHTHLRHASLSLPLSLFISLSLDDNSVYLRAVLRLTERLFTEDLRDPLSKGSETLALLVEEWLKSVFGGVVRDVNVVSFRYVCTIRNLRASLLLLEDCLAPTVVTFTTTDEFWRLNQSYSADHALRKQLIMWISGHKYMPL